MSVQELISSYGYFAIAIGTFFEGETVLVLGGLAAHQGYLELPYVFVYAFLGSLSGDQLYFYIGRIKGKKILEKHSSLKKRSEKVFLLLEKHRTWFILSFRFLYGLRSIAPLLIGLGRVSPGYFLLLNALGALMWTLVIGTLGYLFGQIFELIIDDVRKYELFIFTFLALDMALR